MSHVTWKEFREDGRDKDPSIIAGNVFSTCQRCEVRCWSSGTDRLVRCEGKVKEPLMRRCRRTSSGFCGLQGGPELGEISGFYSSLYMERPVLKQCWQCHMFPCVLHKCHETWLTSVQFQCGITQIVKQGVCKLFFKYSHAPSNVTPPLSVTLLYDEYLTQKCIFFYKINLSYELYTISTGW